MTEPLAEPFEQIARGITQRLDALVSVSLRQEALETGGRTELQLVEIVVADRPQRLRAAARSEPASWMSEVGHPRAQFGKRVRPAAGEQHCDRLEQRKRDRERHDPHQRQPRETHERRTRLSVRTVTLVVTSVSRSFVGSLFVACARVRYNQHARPSEARPPAEVEALARKRRRIEAAKLGEQVGAHEHDGAGNGEDVTDAVVLFLVELPRFDSGMRATKSVNRLTHVEENFGIVGRDELRTDDPGIRAERFLDQQADGWWVEGGVVRTEEQERRPGNCPPGFVG